MDAIVAAWTRQQKKDDLWDRLNAAGVPAGPIYSIADIAKDPQFTARGMLRTLMDPDLGEVEHPGIVPQQTKTPGVWRGPGEMGSHNDEVYGEPLGLSAAERQALQSAGVI